MHRATYLCAINHQPTVIHDLSVDQLLNEYILQLVELSPILDSLFHKVASHKNSYRDGGWGGG